MHKHMAVAISTMHVQKMKWPNKSVMLYIAPVHKE